LPASAFAAARLRAFVVWTVPSPAPLRGQVAPAQSLHLPLTGLGSALPVKGPPTSRAFTHAVSGVVSSECTVRCGQSQACCQLHQGAMAVGPTAQMRPTLGMGNFTRYPISLQWVAFHRAFGRASATPRGLWEVS